MNANPYRWPCRRFLLALEQQGIVDAALRERIIHHAMQLQVKNIDLHVLKVLPALFCPATRERRSFKAHGIIDGRKR